jgi:hypothetical protein
MLIFPTLDPHSYLMVSTTWPNEFKEWGRLTVRLVNSLGQAVDTNELE